MKRKEKNNSMRNLIFVSSSFFLWRAAPAFAFSCFGTTTTTTTTTRCKPLSLLRTTTIAPPSSRVSHNNKSLLSATLSENEKDSSSDGKTLSAATDATKPFETVLDAAASNDGEKEKSPGGGTAATGTVNERLMAELAEAKNTERNGPRSSISKKYGSVFQSTKTEEEREAALAEARDLNGVNPAVAIGGSLAAFAMAAGLWAATSALGEFFAFHPVNSDVYFVERVTAVFRNVVIGLVSLASGFFGVTGMGIFLLGVKVAIGVARGELDPTPIQNKNKSAIKKEGDLELPGVWDLMMNKKPGRRR